MKSHPIEFPEIAAMVVHEICRALKHAHGLGVIHRDIKPENIMIRDDGMLKLMDFGIAQVIDKQRMTVTGQLLGSPAYMAPEQVEGKPADARADIFAVGILLYELLTGQRLFYGENDYHTVELVRKAEVPPITRINPAVPMDMETILFKALAKDPRDRYQSATELSEDLTKLLFKHGLTVGRGDISKLVQFTVDEQKSAQPAVVKKPTTIIDALIQEEILKFTSLDDVDSPMELGAKPLSPEEISVLDPGDFIDPRGWASDLESGSGEPGATPLITDRPPPRSEAGRAATAAALKRSSTSLPAMRQPAPAAPAPAPAKSSVSPIVWVLVGVALLAAVVAGLVLAGIVKI